MNDEINGTGMLEYLSTSGWVPVCYTDAFNGRAADVTCRQLGYPFATNFTSITLFNGRPGIGITRSLCEGVDSGYLFNCVEFTDITCQTQIRLACYNSKCNYSKGFYDEQMYLQMAMLSVLLGPM